MSSQSQVVVLDSNVLIPLIVPTSRSTRLFARLRCAGWLIAASPAILEEVADKLRNKEPLRRWLKREDAEIEKFLDVLPRLLQIVPGSVDTHGAVAADPNDDKIIAAAIEAGASYIVSEDRHLRDLHTYQSIQILGIDEFKQELDRLGIA